MSEEQGSHTSTDKWFEKERPVSPTPSDVSMKSDRSKGEPLSFSKEVPGSHKKERPVSPTPSDVSMKSDRSKGEPLSFSKEVPGSHKKERPVSPAPSDVSMKSDRSKDEPLSFSKEVPGSHKKERPVSPTPSDVSMKSDRSKDEPLSFSKEVPGSHKKERPVSPAPSDVSMKSDRSKDEPLSLLGPPVSQTQVSSASVKTDQSEDDLLNISKDLETLKRRQQLVSNLKKRLVEENKHVEDINHPNQKNTEHIMKENRRGEISDEEKNQQTVVKSVTRLKSISEIFKCEKDQKVRTILTIGEAGIGKSFHAQKFTQEWAKSDLQSKSSFFTWLFGSAKAKTSKAKDVLEVIFPLRFSELNSIKEKKVSLFGLLNDFFKETKESVVSDYAHFRFLFVLDGLDACELPLDFDNNATLTDIREPASVDVLLTNLIRGDLLPSAQLWITSRPSGAEKLPDKLVHRKTQIREKDAKHELKIHLEEKILCQNEVEQGQHETDSELYEKKDEDKLVQIKYDAIINLSKKNKERTVLTRGVAGIGKTFQTRLFMVDWANGKSNKNIDLIVPIHFSELNSKKDEDQSMEDLLHFFTSMKQPVVCYYDECEIVFVLDGLEKCELPLDFDNNKDLSDMKEPASIDVLLTNLIKGNLLPSARLWIVSQPSGVDKIPKQYILKVTECQEKDAKHKLKTHQKKKIRSQNEVEQGQHETDSELYEKKDEDKLVQIKYDAIINLSKKNKERTVLTRGVAGIGKTFQTRLFMVDWANGKSNKNIDLIVPIHFSELNSKKDEDQSMEDLLHFFTSMKQPVVCSYDECEIVFVLDGLEKCELPLDFDNNKDLSDMKEPASIDVLLTNLIKGNLLPSARLWIVSQPSGVDKIPKQYVHKVTECQETLKRRQQLVSNLKKRLVEENKHVEDINHPNQKNTEHIMKEDRRGEISDEEKNQQTVVKSVTRLKSISEIFKCEKDQKVRTILTIGEAGIGKSFHAQKFTQEWAKSDLQSKSSFFTWLFGSAKAKTSKAKDVLEVIFPLRFSELNSIKEKKVSLFGLLNDFFKETKESVVSDYAHFRFLFVLDGLDACELPLDFDNNATLTDIREPASVDVLLTNLIRGDLLPSAQLWITSRPSGAEKLPDKLVHRKTQIREKDAKHELKIHLEEKILCQYEVEQGQHETDSELYEKKDEDKLVQIKYDAIINLSKKNKERTVLTRGVAGIGKTFQTRLFMVDWANGKSNKNIDLIVPIHFSELNSKKDEDQSMEDLLHFFTSMKQPVVCYYDECEIVFVLDGLEKCELPLDFDNNKDLSDMKEPASIDVLLTNLIKGNLLPSARLWIVSQPSGVDKIPKQYVHKVTECQETLKRRQQLVSNLKKRFVEKKTHVEDINHPNQKNTEHVMKEDRREVKSISEIFKCEKDQKVRTILTIGEAGIGKSFHAQKFTQEWAQESSIFTWFINSAKSVFGKANDVLEVIFPLRFSELNSIKQKKVSLFGLLNDFFKETKESVVSDYAHFRILFVLDGLDACELPLDFDNNAALTDIREPASVDVLLTNLIRGDLLPSAQLWITSRPSGAEKLPDNFVHRKTQIREKPDVSSQRNLKSQLKEQFNVVSEGIDEQKISALLNEIYTDLYIVEGERGDVNRQHESIQVQDAKFKPVREETLIKYHDIFKPASGQNKPIRTVLTTGVAGIGKTFASMKYMLDWAEGTANENIYYTFPLPFRELNLRKENEHSLVDLIHQFFPAMKTSEITDYNKYQIMIVLDGLDECRLDLDFSERNDWKDVKKPTSVNVLLTNLIQGNLLPKAQIWITSRPAASNHIPADKVDRVTEVRGFNDEQKEEYFRKRFSDKDLAEKILSHVKKSRSIYIMCHIPVFCWITAKVLEDFVSRKQEEGMPKTLTDMYIHFLLLQCRQTNVKYGGDKTGERSETDSSPNTRNKETILSLGKLAFEELEKGNLLFTEEHLTECRIDIRETAVFSGLFTQIKREGCGLYQQKLFCFVHLSIQEFLAAFYVFHTFNNTGENLLIKPDADSPASDFYKTAVDKALDSKNGDWDLFLRFLLGLSLETNQTLLQELLQNKGNNNKTSNEIIEYIKKKIEGEISDKNLNLFHCLNELNDHSLVEEVKKCLRSETQAFEKFSFSQWSALTYVLLTSDENLDVFELKKYKKSEQVLLGMLPVVKVSKTTLLSWCELSEESCKRLSSSVLSSSSNLTELDLSHNDLLDSGVQLLADGLKSLQCKLEILKLSGCQVTEKGCSFLASALKSNTASHLKHLDLSYNHPGDNGKMMLTAIAEDPNMKLKTLCLDHGGEHRLKPGLKKYCEDLRLDEKTASKRLVLSQGNRGVKTVTNVKEKVSRPESRDRFKRSQVLCEVGLKGFCYWEVEWRGTVGITVAYKQVGRTWDRSGGLGCNEKSWSLLCSKTGCKAMHGKDSKDIKVPPCHKIAVFLDWKGRTLTYYSVTSEGLSLIHTFHAKFTKPLYPGFWFKKGSVTLCEIN